MDSKAINSQLALLIGNLVSVLYRLSIASRITQPRLTGRADGKLTDSNPPSRKFAWKSWRCEDVLHILLGDGLLEVEMGEPIAWW